MLTCPFELSSLQLHILDGYEVKRQVVPSLSSKHSQTFSSPTEPDGQFMILLVLILKCLGKKNTVTAETVSRHMRRNSTINWILIFIHACLAAQVAKNTFIFSWGPYLISWQSAGRKSRKCNGSHKRADVKRLTQLKNKSVCSLIKADYAFQQDRPSNQSYAVFMACSRVK